MLPRAFPRIPRFDSNYSYDGERSWHEYGAIGLHPRLCWWPRLTSVQRELLGRRQDMFAQAYKIGLEDVVSKVRDSAYTSDRGKTG